MKQPSAIRPYAFQALNACGLVCALLFALFTQTGLAQNKNWFRYIDENGTEVITHYIPPQYTQNGYEVLNTSGDVIRVIPPAPTAEEISKREIVRQYEKLFRRFRSIEEIERAKSRAVSSIKSSIAILEGNVLSIEKELRLQIEKAATIERRGHTVSQKILDNIASIKMELELTNELLSKREADKQKEIEAHEGYKELFVKGEILQRELSDY